MPNCPLRGRLWLLALARVAPNDAICNLVLRLLEIHHGARARA